MSGGPGRRLFSLSGRTRKRPRADADTVSARWQAARLSALATGLSRLSHDLRGVMSPALLAAERLQASPDPAVRRAADVLVRAVERTIEVLRDDLGGIRQTLPSVTRARLELRPAIESATPPDLALAMSVPAAAAVEADPEHLCRAWTSLFAHLRALDATRAAVAASTEARSWTLTIDHDGARLIDAECFATPTGPHGHHELVIARDLMRACGGDITMPDPARLVVTLVRV